MTRYEIRGQADVEECAREARALARDAGLSRTAVEAVAISVQELGTNLVRYATGGAIVLERASGPRGQGVCVESQDAGPGIADIELALTDGFSEGTGLGCGLPGVKRLMDDFEISSSSQGTQIKAVKWAPNP